MPPREATNPFPDQYLTLDYEGGPLPMLQHDLGGGGGAAAAAAAATGIAQTQTTDPTAMADDEADGDATNAMMTAAELQEEAEAVAAVAAAEAAAAAAPARPSAQQQQQHDEEPSDPLGNEAFLPHGAVTAPGAGGPMSGGMLPNPLLVQQHLQQQQQAYAAYPQQQQPAFGFGGGHGNSVPSNGGAAHPAHPHAAIAATALAGRPRAAVRNVSADPLSVDTAPAAAVAAAAVPSWNAAMGATTAASTPARGGVGGAAVLAAQVSPHFSTVGVGGNSSSVVPVAARPAFLARGGPSASQPVALFGGPPASSPNFGGGALGGVSPATSGDGHSRSRRPAAQPRQHGAHGANGSDHSGHHVAAAVAAVATTVSPPHGALPSQSQQQTPTGHNNNGHNNSQTGMSPNGNGSSSSSAAAAAAAQQQAFSFSFSSSATSTNTTPPRAVSLTSVAGSGAGGNMNSTAMDAVMNDDDDDGDDDMNSHGTAPISPGSAYPPSSTTSPTNSPLSATVLFPGGDHVASLGSGNNGNMNSHSNRAVHRGLQSVLDQSASLEDDDDDDDDEEDDTNHKNSKGASEMSGELSVPGLDTTTVSESTEDMAVDQEEQEEQEQPQSQQQSQAASSVVTDEDNSTAATTAVPPAPASHAQAVVTPGNSSTTGSTARLSRRSRRGQQQQQPPQPQAHGPQAQPQAQPSPYSNLMVTPLTQQQAAALAQAQHQMHQHPFAQYGAAQYPHQQQQQQQAPPPPPPPPAASPVFGPLPETTTVANLKYYAEQGLIPHVLAALTTPKLKVTGTRLLADYAKQADRRKAVAGNRLILDFVARTMVESPQIVAGQVGPDGSIQDVEQLGETGPMWLAREYAVETIRSLTATEESDVHLMGCPGLLQTLACVARGGPFVSVTGVDENAVLAGQQAVPEARAVGMASPKARLHACIAIMNLSCGKSNKVEIASVPDVLEAMRDVMLGKNFPPPSATRDSGRAANVAKEARLKATTCIKNLSNADANDAALLDTPGLVEALGVVAEASCTETEGASMCTTNACLALMNLSISKSNKHRVFRTPGVMDALMAVVNRTVPPEDGSEPTKPNAEARVKACSALSNLAIGYDNKIPMFNYPGFVECILGVIETDADEARTKACSILWSFAAEMKNQVPVVQRGDILPTLVEVADDDDTTEARFKCVAALTLLAESLANAIPLLESGALAPLMDILHEAGPDPTQWKGQTASWCVGFLMNIAQSDEAVPGLREAGVVELLAPLLTLDHYQSLKAAMAITFVCRYDEGDETYDLLRKTENVIPKITQLLHNTLSGKGGNGYKYGVFTLRSSVGCISALASGPDFMKERIATKPVFESLLQVLSDFCVDGGTPGAIVGGGRDDILSATLAVRALQSLTAHLIPIAGSSSLPKEFVQAGMEERLVKAFQSFETCSNTEIKDETRRLASDARSRIVGSTSLTSASVAKAAVDATMKHISIEDVVDDDNGSAVGSIAASIASSVCGGIPHMSVECWPSATGQNAIVVEQSQQGLEIIEMDDSSATSSLDGHSAVRTFLLADERSGRRFAVPSDPTGGRTFNDNRVWCYRRGRFCKQSEVPDPNFQWTDELQAAYMAALAQQEHIR